jgi:hypothetical protein
MSAVAPVYQLDFRGRHSVSHGALNSALTTVSAAVVAHLCLQTGFATGLQVALSMLSTTVIGLMMIFLWGTVGKTATGGKVAYKSAALIGSCVWSALVAMATWTTETVLQYGGVLIMATVVMGFVAWLAKPLEDQAPETPDALAELEQAARNDLGAEWQLRLQKRLRCEGIETPNISNFPHRSKDGLLVGYTVEVRLPPGGLGWKDIARETQSLANDLDLGVGCGISVRMGTTRRAALIDVTILNILCEDAPYPKELERRSIYDPLLIGVSRRNEPSGPILRERNFGIYGEGGSGKSNCGRVIMAALMQCADTLVCSLDVTGIRLSSPMIEAYLRGEIEQPGVWWVAFDEDEAYLMLRALNRGALARNNHYNDLKLQHNDDKMPCSAQYPQFMVVCDEIKHVGSNEASPRIYRLFKNIHDDFRDPGFRAISLALRGTNEIINQGIQAQQHAVAVMKPKSKEECRWAFGTNIGDIEPLEAPYPGCAQMRMDSAEEIMPYHIYRITPEQLIQITADTASWRPIVDEITLLAMNGRDINGDPFEDLEDRELDCVDSRWDRLRAHLGISGSTAPAAPSKPSKPGNTNSLDAIMEKLKSQTAELVETAYDAVNVDIDRQVSEFDVDTTLAEIFKDFPNPPKVQEPTQEETDHYGLIYQIICEAGKDGIKASQILAKLEERGMTMDRTTVYKWVNTMSNRSHKGKIEWRPNREGSSNGKWYQVEE